MPHFNDMGGTLRDAPEGAQKWDYRKLAPLPGAAMDIRLREITRETVTPVIKLDAGDGGMQVAPNAVSIAQAYFQKEAWFRAIHAGDTLVGFVMLFDPTLVEQPSEPDFFLWRLMIDKSHQGQGYGAAAVEALVDHVRTRPGARRLLVSHMKTAERLGRFYGSLGFVYTGAEDSGELVMERPL
jgi:diamine N-acetyltransferase